MPGTMYLDGTFNQGPTLTVNDDGTVTYRESDGDPGIKMTADEAGAKFPARAPNIAAIWASIVIHRKYEVPQN